MIRTYWLTFRLNDDPDYENRYAALRSVVTVLKKGKAWDEPTSFVMFQSEKSPNELRNAIATVINESVDIVLLAHVGYKEAYIIGHTTQAARLKEMMPYLK